MDCRVCNDKGSVAGQDGPVRCPACEKGRHDVELKELRDAWVQFSTAQSYSGTNAKAAAAFADDLLDEFKRRFG